MIEWIGGNQIDINEVTNVELELQIKFPENYVKIILEHDGGISDLQTFITKNHKEENFGDLIELKRIQILIEIMKKEKIYQYIENIIPIYYIGNIGIGFDYRNCKSDPPVVFFDVNEKAENIIDPIADSFDEFLDKLY